MGCVPSKTTIPNKVVEPTANTDISTTEAPLLQPPPSSKTATVTAPSRKVPSNPPRESHPKNQERSKPAKQPTITVPGEEETTVLPTKLDAAKSQEFKHHLEASLKARDLKLQVEKDVISRVRNRNGRRMQVTLLPDNASAHSKEFSVEVFNNSYGSLGMESMNSAGGDPPSSPPEQTTAGGGAVTTEDSKVHHHHTKRRGSRNRTRSGPDHKHKHPSGDRRSKSPGEKHPSSDRRSKSPGIDKPRIPPNNPRGKESGSPKNSPKPRTERSARHKQPRIKTGESKDGQPTTATPPAEGSDHKEKAAVSDLDISQLGASADTIISPSDTPANKPSSQRRRRREPTNQKPRESHDRREEKITGSKSSGSTRRLAGASEKMTASGGSSRKIVSVKDSKPSPKQSASKRRRATKTTKKPQLHIPENEHRTTPTHGQKPDTSPPNKSPASPVLSPQNDVTSPTRDNVNSAGTDTPTNHTIATSTSKEPEVGPESIEGKPQHSLGMGPSQHTLGSCLPEEKAKSDTGAMAEDMNDKDAGNQEPRTVHRSSITSLVKKINLIKKKSEFEGGVALSDSEDEMGDNNTISTPSVMVNALKQIIKRPALNDGINKDNDDKDVKDQGDEKNDTPEGDGSNKGGSSHCIDIYGNETRNEDDLSSSTGPKVFKFDASDPSVPQFDPQKAMAMDSNLHNSLAEIDRIHQRQSLRDRRGGASRVHTKDGIESLHSSFLQVDALKAAQLSASPKRHHSKDSAKIKQRAKAARARKTARDGHTSTMTNSSMKDHSSGTTSSHKTGGEHRRHNHSPSPQATPPASPVKSSRTRTTGNARSGKHPPGERRSSATQKRPPMVPSN